jgi:hypothetical protein
MQLKPITIAIWLRHQPMHMNVAGLMLHIEQPIQAAITGEREELMSQHLPIHIPHKHTCEFLRPLQAHALVRRQRQCFVTRPQAFPFRVNLSLHDLSIRHLSPQIIIFRATATP